MLGGLEVVAPVFMVIAAGYAAVRVGWFGETAVDGLMHFAQTFAIPALLLLAMATADFGVSFQPAMLAAFFGGATICFCAGLFGARFLFRRDWEDAVAVGFVALFSNSVLLGLPITERAYGVEALAGNYAIVAVHSPFCYLLGTTVMEAVRNRGGGVVSTIGRISLAMLRNPLMIGIFLGVAINLSGLPIPGVARAALDIMVAAALPVALFAMGGVLYRYRPEGDLRLITWVVVLSLLVHPALTMAFAQLAGLDVAALRSAVMTSAMAPGINAYLFANMYGRARRVAASSVLVGTVLVALTSAGWLMLLP